MLRLVLAPEPADFDRRVRRPGRKVLRDKSAKVEDHPHWRRCLDQLHAAYGGICAYYCFYVEPAALPHVEHFVAKAKRGRSLAYEWTNYRLACGHANSCKGAHADVLDPVTIRDGWFQLDLLTLRVHANPKLKPAARRKAVEATIKRLKLCEETALATRQRALARFRAGLSLAFLDRDHPFLAKELRRQGITRCSQLPTLPPALRTKREPERSR